MLFAAIGAFRKHMIPSKKNLRVGGLLDKCGLFYFFLLFLIYLFSGVCDGDWRYSSRSKQLY